MAWVITTATPTDLSRMYAIELVSFETPWSYELLEAEFSHTQARMRVVRQRDPWGQQSEQLVGFCLSWVVADEWQLLQIAVDPDFRRRGIGQMLLRDAIEMARMESAPNLYLEVRASNQAAIQLYRSCHFEEVGVRKKYYQSPPEDAIVFVRVLELQEFNLRR